MEVNRVMVGWKGSINRLRSLDICPKIPARFVLAILGFLGLTNVYALRVNLSVAIVQMDNDTTDKLPGTKVFRWSDSEQGWILSAFFYGYILTQIPGGWLAERVGGKWVFGVGVVMTSLLTLLTPLAAFTNIWLLVTVRVLEGFFEGVTFPAMYTMLGKWAPPGERSRLLAVTLIGQYLGTVVSFPLSALLCQYGFDGGWPSVFYVFGSLGIAWFILWALFVHSSPAEHPRISTAERLYIESSLAAENRKPVKKTPWLGILTSAPVWGLSITGLCDTWGFYVLLTCMPTFIQQTLGCNKHLPIVLNGIFSAIPYTLMVVVVLAIGPIADYMRRRWFSPTATGKILTTFGLASPALFLVLCAYLGSSTPLAITFLTLAVGLNGMTWGGYKVNQLDVAASHAGVLMGLTNTIGNIPGLISPLITKLMAKTPNAPHCSEEYISVLRQEWQQVFIVAAEIYVFAGIVYLILGSGKRQRWAAEEAKSSDSDGGDDSMGRWLAVAGSDSQSAMSINSSGERRPLLSGKIASRNDDHVHDVFA